MIKKIPPIKSQKGIERQYQKQLNKLGKVLILEVRKQVLSFIKAQQSSYVMDGFGDQLGVIFRKLNSIFTGTATASFAETTASQVIQKIGAANKSRFGRAVARATGVDLGNIITSEGLEDFMAVSINKNVSLIKSLPEEYLKQVETIVNNGVVSGARYSTIEKEIISKTGANSKLVNRIKTIARNEVQTINSQITLRRSESLGITKGIYKSSKDERVRKSHAELDGIEFELKKGAWSKTAQKFIQPGITDINCRCSYSPIIKVDEEPKKKKVVKKPGIPPIIEKNEIEKAVNSVKDLPKFKNIPDSVSIPFKAYKEVDHQTYKPTSKIFKKARNLAQKDKKIKFIPLEKIIPTETWIEKSTVLNILEKFNWNKYLKSPTGNIQPPRIVKYEEKYYIHDGHHRLSSLKFLKIKKAPVQLIDMDSMKI